MISNAARQLTPTGYFSDVQPTAAFVVYGLTDPIVPVDYVIPINRTISWDEAKTPDLVIGDTFWHVVTLLHGSASEAFDFSDASEVTVAIVASGNTEKYCDQYDQSSSRNGADWANGELSLYLPTTITADIANHVTKPQLGKAEIQVTLNGDKFTWYGPVNIIPGHVS